jgi:lipoprotein-anchoring transpeptidase ErfK/SrfK
VLSVLRTIVALLAIAGLAAAAASPAEVLHAIEPGVSVSGAHLGGLTAQPASTRVRARFSRPIVVVYGQRTFTAGPAELGARAGVNAAVRAALSAMPRKRIALPVRYSSAAVSTFVHEIAAQVERDSQNAALLGATTAGPRFRPDHPGRVVDETAAQRAIAHELETGARAPVRLVTMRYGAARTVAGFGPLIVIDRAENSLKLFDANRLVRKFPVATGQAIYPTPAGRFRIVVKEANPWWYPPTYDAWAKGLHPVPPGPGNPLGTRWMGLSVPGVGIHGTDEPGSIGYSASHGCIRMQVPDAEWLFQHVRVGTPVFIF